MDFQTAIIVGDVEYRLGEGPKCTIPKGPVELQHTDFDVTLSWITDGERQAAAMPNMEFRRYVVNRDIAIH